MTEAQVIQSRIPIDHKSQEIVSLKARFGFRCLKCGKSEVELGVGLAIDHIVPLAKGGANSIDNYQPLCKMCNSLKGIKVTDYRATPHYLCVRDAGISANMFVPPPAQKKSREGRTQRPVVAVVELTQSERELIKKAIQISGDSSVSSFIRRISVSLARGI